MTKKNIHILHITCVSVLAASCLFLVMAFCLESFNNIIGFNGYAADGAFQLMNPLTRLAHGWVLGRDFNYFHGPGVAIVHYPLFILFGQGLFGSEMSRWLTSILFFVVTTALLTWSFFRDKKYSFSTIALSSACIFLFSALYAGVVTPTNSLLGVRTTFPILVGALILSRSHLDKKISIKRFSVRLYDLLLGSGIALSILCGTEQGIAVLGAYIIAEMVHQVIIIKPKKIKKIALCLASFARAVTLPLVSTALWLLIIASIISLGHPLKLLTYNLITVPSDQFWFFGAEPQGFLSLHILAQQLANPTIIPLYVVGAIAVCSLAIAKWQKLLSHHEWHSISFIFFYGLLTLSAMIGYYSPLAQIEPAQRAFIIVSSLVATILLTKRVHTSLYQHLTLATASIGISTGIIILSATMISPLSVKSLIADTWENIQGNHATLLGPEWKDRLHKFEPYIVAAKQSSNYPLWSTYASLYEQQNNLMQPSSGGYDYIIHALGNGRSQYTRDFIKDKPELVITLRPSYFGFEEWLWGRDVEFYQHLVQNYEIVDTNDSHILWRRISSPHTASTSYPLKIRDSYIALPTATMAGSQLIKVTVHYSVHSLPGFKKIPRYIIKPLNTISTIGFSMPPQGTTWSFLVVLKQNQPNPSLKFYADGLIPGASLDISSASFQSLSLTQKETQYFTEKSILLE